jgi:Zn-finger nucleic acid-binding protein
VFLDGAMTDSFDERRKAQEEGFFEKANKEALARLARRQSDARRLSPATGSPMQQITTLGIVIDYCPTSGGVWLDAGELEQLASAVAEIQPSLPELLSQLPTGMGTPALAQAVKEHQVSPISGKELSIQSIAGITVGLCKESKGIWIDSRALAQMIATSHQTLASSIRAFIAQVLGS